MLPIHDAHQQLRPPAADDIPDTPGASSSNQHQAAAQDPATREITVPRTSTLQLSEPNKADVMAQMFVASMQHQKYLMKLLLGIHLFHG